MVSMKRTSSMPNPLSDYLSRIKVFSGRASQDEVSTEIRSENQDLSIKHTRSLEPRSRSRSRESSLSLALVPTLSIGDGGKDTRRRSLRDRFKDLTLDAKRRPPTPVIEGTSETPMLTQDSECKLDLNEQSNDLIMSALGRRSSGPTPAKSGSSTPNSAKPTAGALAALGLSAARVGAPSVSSKAPVASGRSTPQPQQQQQQQPASPAQAQVPAPAAAPQSPPAIQTAVPPSFATQSGVPVVNSPIAPTPITTTQVQIADNPVTGGTGAKPVSSDNPTPILMPTADRSRLLPSRPLGVGGFAGGVTTPDHGSERPSREPSPFFAARKSREERRARDRSPEIGALRKDSVVSTGDSDGESVGRGRSYRPRNSAYEADDDSGNDADDNDDYHTEDDDVDSAAYFDDDDDELWDEDHFFDEETEKNTEANAVYLDDECVGPDGKKRENFDVYGEETEQDMLGEGPNVVMAPEPLFALPDAKSRTSQRTGLEVITSRPMYARDRCTINIIQGDPDEKLDESGKRMRRYVVLSDLSEESRYAVQWAVGTVARDGDEIFLISVIEDESKVDPKHWSSRDQSLKIKLQKERQTTALLLVRQITSLLERTRLNITVTCQALHAKNARYMLLDLIDFLEPTLVIVGSRGLGQIKGILLGSTSHYLVQKSSVPVMVARRRLRRPLRSTNPEDLRRSPRVALASANIEKIASSKQEDDIVDATDDDDPKIAADKRRDSAASAA